MDKKEKAPESTSSDLRSGDNDTSPESESSLLSPEQRLDSEILRSRGAFKSRARIRSLRRLVFLNRLISGSKEDQ